MHAEYERALEKEMSQMVRWVRRVISTEDDYVLIDVAGIHLKLSACVHFAVGSSCTLEDRPRLPEPPGPNQSPPR